MRLKNWILIFAILNIAFVSVALAVEKENKPTYNFTKKGLVKSSDTESYVVLKPELIFKGKYEFSTESGEGRFNLKNSRVGVRGNLNKFFSYRFLLDLNSEGKFSVLDLYGKIQASNRLSITFGQQGLSLFNPYTIDPKTLDYANRPFVGKYIFSSRDMGIAVAYKLKKEGFPIDLEAGVYNGDGINNPQWTKTPSYGGRLAFGSYTKGFRFTTKAYRNKVSNEQDFLAYGADIRITHENFRFETEFMSKHNYFNKEKLTTALAQGLYSFPLESKVFSAVQTALRWDAMGYDFVNKGFGVNRGTIGLNFILRSDSFYSLIRLNYEHYFKSKVVLPEFKNGYADDNKISLELLFCF
jgi:hypothetical protein